MTNPNTKKTCTDEEGRTFTEGQTVWFRLRDEICRGTIAEICDDGTVLVANHFEDARLGLEEIYEDRADAA